MKKFPRKKNTEKSYVDAKSILPLEVWGKVIKALTVNDILNARLVCLAFKSQGDYVLNKKDRLHLVGTCSHIGDMNRNCFDVDHKIGQEDVMIIRQQMTSEKWKKIGLLLPNIKILQVSCSSYEWTSRLQEIKDNFKKVICLTLDKKILHNEGSFPDIRHFRGVQFKVLNLMPALESIEVDSHENEEIQFKFPDTCTRLIIGYGSVLRWQQLPSSLEILHSFRLTLTGYNRRYQPVFPSLKELLLKECFYRHEATELVNFLCDHKLSLRKLVLDQGIWEGKIQELMPAMTSVEELKLTLTTVDQSKRLREGLDVHASSLKKLTIISSLIEIEHVIPFIQNIPKQTSSLKLEVFNNDPVYTSTLLEIMDNASKVQASSIDIQMKFRFSPRWTDLNFLFQSHPDFKITYLMFYRKGQYINLSICRNKPTNDMHFPIRSCS